MGTTEHALTKTLTKPKMVRVEGVVYCHDHTVVHEDSTSPYGDGDNCRKAEHRPVYARLRKGDYDDRTVG